MKLLILILVPLTLLSCGESTQKDCRIQGKVLFCETYKSANTGLTKQNCFCIYKTNDKGEAINIPRRNRGK